MNFTVVILLLQCFLATYALFLVVRHNSVVRTQISPGEIIADKTFRLVRSAGYNYPDESIRRIVILTLAVSALGGFIISPLFALLVPLGVAGVVIVFLLHKTKAEKVKGQNHNDDICYAIARHLRSGSPLAECVQRVHKDFLQSEQLTLLVRRMEKGMTLNVAIDAMKKTGEFTSQNEMFFAALALSQHLGGNAARIFERIGDSFHQTYELFEDTASTLTQVRLSAFVVGVLPGAMLLFSLVLGSKATTYLFTHPLGWICMIVGVALETVGVLWMKKLVKSGVGQWVL
jgi:tight adherence protein B